MAATDVEPDQVRKGKVKTGRLMSERFKRLYWRGVWIDPKLRETDRLNEYDEDYTAFVELEADMEKQKQTVKRSTKG